MYLITDTNCSILWKEISRIFRKFNLHEFFSQCMSIIEDMTKEKQALSDEHQKQMDQTKGVSTHVPTDNINKFEIYQQISYMDNVKGVNHGSQIRLFLVI